MSKQTAVQLILDKFSLLSDGDFKYWMINNYDELIEMEREQIQDAFYHGIAIDAFNVNNKWTEAEKYYKQNFIGQDE